METRPGLPLAASPRSTELGTESFLMASEGPRCLVCGESCCQVFRRCPDGLVLQCSACGLGFVHPQPVDAHALYRSDKRSQVAYYRHCAEADRRTFTFVLDRVPSWVAGRRPPCDAPNSPLAPPSVAARGHFRPPVGRPPCDAPNSPLAPPSVAARGHFRPPVGRVLDVGCATGTFLEVARSRGFEGLGVELSPESLAWCRSRGLSVVPGPVEQAGLPQRRFDIIHLGDVLEHLPDPAVTLRFLRGLLRDQGLIVISTPNFASLATRVFQIKPREHLFYFTARSLARLLEGTGFRPLSVTSFDRWREVGSLALSPTFPPGSFLGKVLAMLHDIRAGRPLIIRFPFRENLLAFGRADDGHGSAT
jgi:SAM-dependent methyltransferase